MMLLCRLFGALSGFGSGCGCLGFGPDTADCF